MVAGLSGQVRSYGFFDIAAHRIPTAVERGRVVQAEMS
jgi:hypothetical protein